MQSRPVQRLTQSVPSSTWYIITRLNVHSLAPLSLSLSLSLSSTCPVFLPAPLSHIDTKVFITFSSNLYEPSLSLGLIQPPSALFIYDIGTHVNHSPSSLSAYIILADIYSYAFITLLSNQSLFLKIHTLSLYFTIRYYTQSPSLSHCQNTTYTHTHTFTSVLMFVALRDSECKCSWIEGIEE